MSVYPQAFFDENQPSSGEIMRIVRKISSYQGRNVLGLLLRATITDMSLYPLSLYIRQAPCEFLRPDIGCIPPDGDIHMSVTILQSGV